MIPSSKWFPSSLSDRAMWFHSFTLNMQSVGTSLGFSTGELTALGEDDQWLTFLASVAMTMESYRDAIRNFRVHLTEGDISDPAPVFPADVTFAPPAGPHPTGIFQRLDNMVKRIRVSPAYTPEIGGLLQIIPTKSEDLVESEMKPVLKTTPMPASVVEVTFTRGKSDGVVIETKLDNAAAWTTAGTYFKSPASLTIPDGTGLPHSVQVRARYIIGNEPVGLNSDVVNVVTTP